LSNSEIHLHSEVLWEYYTCWTGREKGGTKEEKESTSLRILLIDKFCERNSFSMSSITQDMKYRQSTVGFALKYGAGRASRKFNRARSYVYFWLNRYDGTLESLACRSRRPHYHPRQHNEDEITLLKNMCRRSPNSLSAPLILA